MTAFPKYPKYKDSGVAWLGDVPEHWEVSRSRRVFKQRTELARRDDQQLSATQAYGVIPQADYEERIGRKVTKISMHLEKRKHVELDDFVISMRSFQGGLERAWAQGCIRSSYTVLEPAVKVAPSYFAYLFKSPQYIGALQATGNFIRDGQDLTFQNYILVDLPLPPFAEQERIGAFLDEKTAQIDALIAKKQRQIELLDEQKAILINRAVTRGLNSQAELQDSGIPWIGPIPKHWQVAPLYGRCEVRLGKMLDGSRITGRRLQPYLRNTDVQWFKINTDSLPMMDFSVSEYERYSVRRGDLLVCEGGEPGRAAIWESDDLCFFQKALHRVRPIKGDHPRFLLYLFRNAVTQAAFSGFEKATIAHLTGEQLRRFRFAFPPPDEQKQIAAHLDKVGDAFEIARTNLESQIQTLQTLRSTLIAHAVTGKIAIPAATA
jgi:type I restriction enzyme S subunit